MAAVCLLLVIGEAAMIIILMQSTSIVEHFIFYLYFDYLLLISLLVPLVGFFRFV